MFKSMVKSAKGLGSPKKAILVEPTFTIKFIH